MASVQTDSLFLEHLRQTRLVAEAVVERLKEEHQEHVSNDTGWAQLLIRAKVLNTFQAGRILQGRWQELVFGDYYAVHVLHLGGIGKVHLARKRNTPGWFVAKVLQDKYRHDARLNEHFQLEAEALISLHHPNLVQGIEFFPAAVGDAERQVLMMEFVEGPNLREWVAIRGPLPIGQACDFIMQAALGLQHVHEHQFLHRDVKPANIVIAATGIAKVIDFGLAKYTGDDPRWKTVVDRKPGTPDFVAPERVLATAENDPRSDIYSLGCTLFYLLTGQVPFPTGTHRDKLRAHVRQPPPAVGQLRTDLPPELAATVHRMIAKRPADRIAIMADVAQLLQPFAIRTPVAVNLRALLQARFKSQAAAAALPHIVPPASVDSVVALSVDAVENEVALPAAEENTLSPLTALESAVRTITDELQAEREENARLIRELDEMQAHLKAETTRWQAKVQELAQRLLAVQEAHDHLLEEREQTIGHAAAAVERSALLETTLRMYREQVSNLTARTEQMAGEINHLQVGLRSRDAEYAALRTEYAQSSTGNVRQLDETELFDEVLADEDLLRDLTRGDSAW